MTSRWKERNDFSMDGERISSFFSILSKQEFTFCFLSCSPHHAQSLFPSSLSPIQSFSPIQFLSPIQSFYNNSLLLSSGFPIRFQFPSIPVSSFTLLPLYFCPFHSVSIFFSFFFFSSSILFASLPFYSAVSNFPVEGRIFSVFFISVLSSSFLLPLEIPVSVTNTQTMKYCLFGFSFFNPSKSPPLF